MIRNKFLLYALLFCAIFSNGQNIDSLETLLQKATHDTTRCKILELIIETGYDDNVWPVYNKKLMDIAESHLTRIGAPLTVLDIFYLRFKAVSLNNCGYLEQSKGHFAKALEYFNNAIEVEKLTNNKANLSMSYNNIAGIYCEQRLFKEAIVFFSKSLLLREEINDKYGIAQSLCNLGTVYDDIDDTAKARKYFIQSLETAHEINDESRLGLLYNNLGGLYREAGRRDLAFENYEKSLAINTKLNNRRGMCIALGNIALINMAWKKTTEARRDLLKAMDIANELGFPLYKQVQALGLYQLETGQGNYKEALKYYQLYVSMRDTITNAENNKAAVKQQILFEFEKQKAVDNAIHQKELVLSNEREQKQRIVSIAVGGGLVLVFLFAIFIFNRLRISNQQKRTIEKQKEGLEEKNRIIEEKQKDILDSIHYAKRIQQSLLPSEKYIERKVNQNKKT